MNKQNQCRICGCNDKFEHFKVEEKMFQTKDEFNYFVCSNCGCLQIEEYPADVSVYYPNDSYYSYQNNKDSFAIDLIKTIRAKMILNSHNNLRSFFISKLKSNPIFNTLLPYIEDNKNVKLLDIGCGIGKNLQVLHKMGFKNTYGIEPFNEKDLILNNTLHIYKKNIEDINDLHDFIVLNYVLEHLPNQINVFDKLNSILKIDGKALIRIPIFPSFAFEKYKENWCQWDPPRHFYIHTLKSFELLCQKAGFKIIDTIFDSFNFQFWGSELYKMDKPLIGSNPKKIFSTQQLKEWELQSIQLNKNKTGDQVAFVIQKI